MRPPIIKLPMWILLLVIVLLVSGCEPKRIRNTLDLPGVQSITGLYDKTLTQPNWHPTEKRLLAADPGGSAHGPAGGVYTIEILTRQIEPVEHTSPAVSVYDPTWSASGKEIAYHYSGPDQPAAGIYLLDLATGKSRNIATWANNAALSPAGNQIALWGPVDRQAKEPIWKILVLDLSTLREQVIYEVKAKYIDLKGLSWSRDGRKIAFSIPTAASSSASRAWYNIYAIDADGRNLQQVTSGANADAIAPTWSPNGQFIAYTQGNEFRQAFLWVANADGSCPVQLLDNVGVNSPAWSPDGRYIAFEYDWGLYTLDLQSEVIAQRLNGLDCK
jgi:Tol biopolymer transport system component